MTRLRRKWDLLLVLSVIGCLLYFWFSSSPPALPTVWVDNNELTCGMQSNCYTGSPGLLLTPPVYEFVLGGLGWAGAAPPSYCTSLFSFPFPPNGDGLQNAADAVEACRTAGIANSASLGFIVDLPVEPLGTYVRTSATNCAGCGLIVPQTSATYATAPIVLRSVADATLAAMPEPVGAGGIQDNLVTSTAIGLNNPDGTGGNLYYVLGGTNGTGSGACATPQVICGVTTVSVNTTAITQVAALAGTPQLLQLASGYVSPSILPTTAGTNDTCGSGLAVDFGTANFECVTPVAGANQTGLYGIFLKPHTFGATVSYVPNAGAPCLLAPGSFQLATGACTNIGSYNYLKFMPQIEASAPNSSPIDFCSGLGSDAQSGAGACIQIQLSLNQGQMTAGSTTLNVASGPFTSGMVGEAITVTGAAAAGGVLNTTIVSYNSATQVVLATPAVHATSTGAVTIFPNNIGPDHWQFEDLAVSFVPGDTNGGNLIQTGDANATTSFLQWATDIHFRRILMLGDWQSLATGYNSISVGAAIDSCLYCSMVGSQGSQLMRPGAEGHVFDPNGNNLKFTNDWFEGESMPMLEGGFGSTRGNLNYIAATNLQIGRMRGTFPFSWLGANGANGTTASGTIPNNNNYYGAAAAPWTVAPTMIYISNNPAICLESATSCVVWVSGDPLHDSNSSWAQGSKGAREVTINGGVKNGYVLAAAANWTQLCGSFCFPATAPTVIPLDPSTPTCSATLSPAGCGTASVPVPLIMGLTSVVRKNCFEFKEGQNVLIYGSIFENCDNSGSQNGTVVTFDPRNTSGTVNGASLGQNYNVTAQDFNIVNTIFRNSCEGWEVDARGLGVSGVTFQATRLLFANSLQYAVSGTWPGCNGESVGITLENGHNLYNSKCGENSGAGAGTATCQAFASIDGGAPFTQACPYGSAGCPAGSGAVVYTTFAQTLSGNQFVCGIAPTFTGAYVWVGGFANAGNNSPTPAGFQCIGATATTLTLVNALGVSESPTGSPAGICNNTEQVPSGSPACGNPVIGQTSAFGFQVVNIRNGEPVSISASLFSGTTPSNCQNFVRPLGSANWQVLSGTTVPTAIGPITTGSTAWTGTWSASNVSVTFPWSTGGSPDTSGNCILSNVQSGPSYTTLNHDTLITDSIEAIGMGPLAKNGPTFLYNHALINSILLSNVSTGKGWSNSAVASPTEGLNTEAFDNDLTSLSAFAVAFPGRSAALGQYVEFGNNPAYPDPFGSGCTGSGCVGAGAPSLFYPANSCSAVGFFYPSCPAGAVPLTAPDYHYYALSGGPLHNQASDGGDLGVIFSQLDSGSASQTTNLYVCSSTCGSPGPFPDSPGGTVQTPAAPAVQMFLAVLRSLLILRGGIYL